MSQSEQPSTLDALVRELDVYIRARYPLVAVTTHDETRLCRLMGAVAQLPRFSPKTPGFDLE